ncbi:MAG: AbrB/MazE/SpoVT family DNA-binding domain-containing protein [Candidatus Baldrarchaeota archaeon]|nr:AbrB/MazE/SpoVT family DNA-binding domain-containing protein [Candidatus Baldrarchaeota archaeon]
MRVKVSSKGQVVIPKKIREKLGITKGSVLNVKLDGKKIILETVQQPPQEIFIKAGKEITDKLLREAKTTSDKSYKLLAALGVIDDSS